MNCSRTSLDISGLGDVAWSRCGRVKMSCRKRQQGSGPGVCCERASTSRRPHALLIYNTRHQPGQVRRLSSICVLPSHPHSIMGLVGDVSR